MKNIKSDNNKRNTVLTVIAGVIFSFMTAFVFAMGKSFDTTDNIDLKDLSLWFSFFVIFLGVFAFSLILNRFSDYDFTFNQNTDERKVRNIFKILIIALPSLMWILAWLSCFPGVFSYDCFEEWQMVANGNLSTHHPLIHVLILGGLTELSVMITKSGNLGIAVYVALQMIFAMFVIKRVYDYISSRTKSSIVLFFTILFYTVSPVIQLFAIAATKDSVFAFFELWFLVNCFKVKESEKQSKVLWIEFAVSLLGTMLFRKNGVYIAVASMIVFILTAKEIRKKLLTVFACIAALYFIYAFVPNVLPFIQKTESAEMLAVPMQQMARVYALERSEVTDEEAAEITRFIPEKYLEKYIPTTADSVKLGFNNEEFNSHKAAFFKIWLKLGLKHPVSYVNAFLVNTVDLWYPLALNDGYRWLYGNSETESNFFDYRVAEPGNQIIINEPFYRYYYAISTSKTISTGLFASILLNPGWCLLIWFMLLIKSIFRKEKNLIVFHTAMGMSILTVLFGPMSMIRYVLIFYLVIPLDFLFLGSCHTQIDAKSKPNASATTDKKKKDKKAAGKNK